MELAALKHLNKIPYLLWGENLVSTLEPVFLAHLSQRLIRKLIGYSWPDVRPRRRSQCSKIFFSETAWPIKAKFYVEPPWVGGMIFC